MLLKTIPYPENELDPNLHQQNIRLKEIRNQIYGAGKTKEYKSGRYIRHVINAAEWRWINEIQIEPLQNNDENFLVVKMYAGDTKEQGKTVFQNNPSGIREFPKIFDYQTTAEPYLRFAHYDSSIFVIFLSPDEAKKTHSIEFFRSYAGKHKRENWHIIKSVFDKYVPGWSERQNWDKEFENSNRNYFDLALGTLLTIYLPYEECQELDDAENNPALVNRLRDVIEEMRKTVERLLI